MKVRRRARMVALQALFEVDIAGHQPDTCLRGRLLESPVAKSGLDFCHSLLTGVVEHGSALDAIIHRIAPEWPMDQMAPIDRNILRLAAFEILYYPDTPPKVAINEAVELAKIFGSDSSGRFVNGVLGTILAQKQQLLDAATTPEEPKGAQGVPYATPSGDEAARDSTDLLTRQAD